MVQNRKHPKNPLMNEWLNKLWYIHTMKCYSAKKKKKEPIYNTYNNLEVFQEHYTWLKKKKTFNLKSLHIVKFHLHITLEMIKP